MSFIGKLVGYFMNELIVKTLANSKSFQRFAIRSDSFIKDKKQVAKTVSEEVIIKAKSTSDTIIKEKGGHINNVVADKSGFDLGVFLSHMKDEMVENQKAKPVEKKSKYSGGSQ